MTTDSKKLLTTRRLCERYGVVDRTIDRWIEKEILPRPMWVNGRRYFDETEVEKRERERMAARDATAA